MNVRVISEGGHSVGTRVLLEDGGELQGVRRVVFTAEVDAVAIVEAELYASSVEAEGQLRVMAAHPVSGEIGRVARIVFDDGSEWVAP